MAAPSMIIITVFIIIPIIYSLYMSFHDWNIMYNIKDFIGFGNYKEVFQDERFFNALKKEVFQDERFFNALKNTLIYTVSYVPILVILSLALAAFINEKFIASGFYKTVLFIPAITSMAIIAIIFRFLLDGDIGYVSLALRKLGISVPDFLRDPETAMWSVVLTSVWRWVGFYMVIFLSGFNSIPDSLYEAAEIDGAGKLRQFFSISLPLLMPTISFTLITNLINSFQVFDPVYVMTKGGPMFSTEVLVYYVYYMGFNVFDMGYASSMAFILFLIILVFTLIQLKGFMKSDSEGDLA